MATSPEQPQPPVQPASQPEQVHHRTRIGATWVGLGGGVVFLVLVIAFILENLQTVRVTWFGERWSAPLGVDLLIAAVLGALVVLLAGSARLLQLRVRSRRSRRQTEVV